MIQQFDPNFKNLEEIKVERQIRKQVKLCLEKNKIKIPYPQIEVHNGKQ